MIELRKLSVAVLIVVLVFGFGFAPVNPQTTNYFSVIKVYWGTEEPIEVSPGDTATLSVVLRYEYQYSARSLKAELSLPEGFKAVGGEQRALAYYASTISIGSIITLDFSIFIKGASKGSYLTHLQLNYYIADRSQWFNELLDVSFEVTGKPSLNVTSLNDSLNEGNQQVRILIQNEGDAVAESLKIVRVYSSSAPTEIKGGTVLGRLEPGSQVTVPVYVYVSSSLKGGLLTLTVETTCKGPNGVVYSFSKNLLIPVGVGKSVVLGRVIGEEREGISNVEIEVYSSDGAYVGNINNIGYITSDGHFAVSLTLGSYVLHFSKEGYAKVTKSISLKSGGEIIDLGDVTLLKALRLSSSILSLSASPGDKLLLPFSISNICDESETVDFKVSKPMGWSTKILGQVGNEVKRIQFSSSGSLSFQLEVMVPISALGSNSLILTAVGKTNSTLNFTIDVEAFQSVISCQFPGKASTPGDVVRFQVRLTNPLGVKTAFMVSVDNIPKNWTVSVKNTGGESLTQATLDRSEFADLVVEATSPDLSLIHI